MSALELAGQRALTEARRLWNLDVVDFRSDSKNPRAAECLATISEIIRFGGWLPAGGYKGGNSSPQWCGLFAAWCWAKGAGFDPKWIPEWFASTLRLIAWARYERNPANGHANDPRPAALEDRRLCVELKRGEPLAVEPREGDIVIVGDGSPHVGDHVTLCAAWNANRRSFTTISGNGGGMGPKGDSREGVSLREYLIDVPSPKYRAEWLIRFGFHDLLAERP